MHTLTLTFPTLAEVQAAVAKLTGTATPGKSNSGTAKTDTSAATTPTATAGKADAPETKPDASDDPFDDAGGEEAKPLVFKTDVVGALRDYSKKEGVDQAKFGALLKKYGVAKVPELEAKGEAVWRKVLADIAA